MSKNILLGLFFPILLFSENLESLIEMSLVNKNIETSKISNEAIKQKYESAKKGYLPSVSVGASYANALNEMSGTARNSANANISLSYTIYDGGKRGLTYDSYESQIEGSQMDLSSLKNQVSLDVVQHYFSYLAYKAQKEAKYKEIEQLNAQYKRLTKFFEAGVSTIDEIDRIVSSKESANVQLHEIELNLQTILHNLEYLTGKSVSVEEGSSIKISEESVELRDDIKSLEQSAKTQIIDAKSVKSANYPQLTLDNTYTYYENYYDDKALDNDLYDDQNILSINLKWNIFDFGSTTAAYESAYKSALSTKSKYEYEKQKANVDLKLAQKSYEINKLKIKSAKASLKAATSTYDAIKNKYENGLVDNVSFLEALSDQSDAQSSLSASKFDLEISKATLVYQKGKDIWEYIK